MTDRTTTKSLLLASTLILSSTLAIGQEKPADFLTEEFLANYGLGLIRAQDAYAAGFTGKGVTIAIVDAPVQWTHPELEERIVSPSSLPVVPLPGLDVPYHGAHVSGIAGAERNEQGMMGVAFEANLAPVLGPNEVDGYGLNLDWGADTIRAGAGVMNGSFSSSTAPKFVLPSGEENPSYRVVSEVIETRDELLNHVEQINIMAQADVVMVFAAGNSRIDQPIAAETSFFPGLLPIVNPGLTASGDLYRIVDMNSDLNNPDTWTFATDPEIANLDMNHLKGRLITTVAIGQYDDGGLFIPGFSNLCGIAADWCVAAPGVEILSAYPLNSYKELTGTSMAAPHVSGVAALVRQAFPYMTAPQVIEVILTTAQDFGLDPTVLGHGLVNAGRAVRGPVEFGHPSLLPGQDSIFAPVFAVDTEGHDSIWSNDISGAGGFRKAGDGRLTLTGDNSYTGATEILGGTLRVDGNIATSDLSVAGPARVEGRGTLGTAQVAGTIAPGNSVGVLNIAGDLTLQSGARIEAEIDATGADLIAITGDVTIDPNVTLVMLAQPGLMLDTGYEVLTTGGWSAPTEWSGLIVSASSAFGPSGRCVRAQAVDSPMRCGA